VGPLYWAVTLFLLGLVLLFPRLFNSTRASPLHVLGSFFFIPVRDTQGELLPLLHVGWTLNYEVFFYSLAALCLSLRRRTAWLLTALAAAFFLGTFGPRAAVWTEFLSNSRLLEFGLGVTGFELSRRFTLPNVAVCLVFVVGGCASLFLVEVNRPAVDPFLGFGLPALIILLGMLGLEAWLPDNASTRALVLLGDSSYALYLCHTFVLAFLDRKLAPSLTLLRLETPFGASVGVAASCIAAVAIYLFVDKPIVRFARSVVRRRSKAVLCQ